MQSPRASGPTPTRSTPSPATTPERGGATEVDRASRRRSATATHGPAVVEYFAALAVAAVWVARVFAPALRGWRSGIAGVIAWADAAAGLLSQLLAVVGVLLMTRLLLRAFSASSVGTLQRLALLPAGSAVVALVAMASQVPLDPILSLGIATASGVGAALASPGAIVSPRTRAAALVVTAVAVASLMQATARRFALQASHEALTQLFVSARYLATAAAGLMAGATLLGFIWLAWDKPLRFWLKCAALLATLAVLAWGAQAGTQAEASSWQVLLSRIHQELARHPRPLLIPHFHFVTLTAPLLVATYGIAAARDKGPRAAIALALVSGAHTDLALLAMALLAAATIVVLEGAGMSGAKACAYRGPG